jgi:endonuclease/exonuclease/phosphatase family metal-dependent hydrolase
MNQSAWLWVVRVALLAGAAALWGLARVCLPHPAWLGTLLALTFVGGALLGLRGALRFRSRREKRPLADLALGLGAASAALTFFFAVLSNDEGPLPVAQLASEAAAPGERLRVVDFNVLHGAPDFAGQETRFQDTLAAFRALNPDIIILQEAWETGRHGNMARRLGEALRFNSVYARANGSRRLIGFEEGSAVLSRFPIRAARRLLLAPRRPWWERRIALVATLDLGGRPLTVAGLHCHDWDEGIAAEQAHSLLARLPQAGPVIVAGDFNAGSGSPAVTQFTQAGFADALPGGIDHLLLPQGPWGWQLAEAAWTFRPDDLMPLIGKRVEISDHPAIVADLVPQRPGRLAAP